MAGPPGELSSFLPEKTCLADYVNALCTPLKYMDSLIYVYIGIAAFAVILMSTVLMLGKHKK